MALPTPLIVLRLARQAAKIAKNTQRSIVLRRAGSLRGAINCGGGAVPNRRSLEPLLHATLLDFEPPVDAGISSGIPIDRPDTHDVVRIRIKKDGARRHIGAHAIDETIGTCDRGNRS